MSKRKSEEIGDSTAAKVCRLEEEEEEAEGQQGPASTGDIGLIESISLQNFMCHHLPEPLQFGSNVNFIVGNNGSGKSAILTALIVGLGGKAMVTNRGVSLKDFVKTGEPHADITVKLRNRGADAYRQEAYGDCISIQHRIFTDGSRTYKLRSKSGRLVSNKKEELIAILDHFNIQLDNPVSILNQEMSKQFLHSKSETNKYKFFMKATLLEQMKRDYIHIKHTQTVTRQQVERQEEVLADLKQEYLQKKQRYEDLSSLSDMKEALEKLKKAMAWCLVREKEVLVQQLRDEVEKEESNCRDQDKLQLCQTRLMQVEKKLQLVRNQLEALTEEQRSLSQENFRLKEEVKAAGKAYKEQELVCFRALNSLRQSEQEQSLLQEKINKARSSGVEGGSERARRQQSLSGLREQLAELEATCAQLNREISGNSQALVKGQEERDKLRLEERSFQASYESKLRRRNQLLAAQSNKLKRFGECVPELLDAVAKATAAGRFIKTPVGPIGACLSLKDPSLAMAVESCLRSFMKAFCCDNYRDEALLQQLMSRCHPKGNRPQIIVSPYPDRVYNVHGRKAQHPEYPNLLDVITASSPVIINCLIDMRGIESVLIIQEKDKARRVMQQSSPPRYCREAFTAEGDQVYPNRYYTSDFHMAKFLGGDLETEIRILEAEVENQQAQLSRFQLQVNSVCEDIRRMESRQSGTVTTLKKTLARSSQVKASITELEMMEEEKTDHISSLEEVARENRQKIEVEKQTAQEAKTEFNEYRKMLDAADFKYSSAKERTVQLSEDMEPLREEQLKLEAECAKLERNLKIFENKTKAHEENIQAMRSELSQREEVLQEYVSKAAVISPKRQQVNRSANSLDKEIIILEKKIEVYERSHGKQEQVLREYSEALALYRGKTMQTRDLRRFVDKLDNIISDRQDRYKRMRRSLSVRCKLYFNNFLIKMNCCGSMIFDHDNETLAISVQPPGSGDAGVRDIRSLSGGERSFSTVCFMLSLWEITESPFRCLDEFDVYMDMHNRRISLDLLLELSERQHLRQFIFITPLTTRSLPKSSLIRIHQLQGRHGEQQQTCEEEEKGSLT